MKPRSIPSAAVALAALAGLPLSCASNSTALSRLPERAIDRELTLPEDVSVWRPVVGRAFDADPDTLLFPFQWEQGYTDRLTLVWTPLPFQARYLLHRGDRHSLTAEATLLTPAQARDRNFDWRPALELGWRYRLAQALGLEARAFAQAEIKRASDQNFARTIGLRAGPLVQLHPRVILWPSLTAQSEQGRTSARYLGALPAESLPGSPRAGTRVRFPLSLEASVTLHRQWELWASLTWFRLGYEAGYDGLPVYGGVAYFF